VFSWFQAFAFKFQLVPLQRGDEGAAASASAAGRVQRLTAGQLSQHPEPGRLAVPLSQVGAVQVESSCDP
jgi:hypothetical protein